MKTTLVIALLALCALGQRGVSSPQTKHEVVILQGRAMQTSVSVGDATLCGNGYGYCGIDVYNISASDTNGVPELPFTWHKCPPPGWEAPPRIPLAKIVAEYLDRGYQIRHIEPSNKEVWLVK